MSMLAIERVHTIEARTLGKELAKELNPMFCSTHAQQKYDFSEAAVSRRFAFELRLISNSVLQQNNKNPLQGDTHDRAIVREKLLKEIKSGYYNAFPAETECSRCFNSGETRIFIEEIPEKYNLSR